MLYDSARINDAMGLAARIGVGSQRVKGEFDFLLSRKRLDLAGAGLLFGQPALHAGMCCAICHMLIGQVFVSLLEVM